MIASIQPISCADQKDIFFRYVVFVKAIGSEAMN